jgi:hypothetical protein
MSVQWMGLVSVGDSSMEGTGKICNTKGLLSASVLKVATVQECKVDLR